jgi:hypothetical protein
MLTMLLVGFNSSNMKYILDTHALIWFLEGNYRLELNAKEILSDSSSELVLPAIPQTKDRIFTGLLNFIFPYHRPIQYYPYNHKI